MEKVIIIGSGPAGFTAAIYAARANLAPLLFQGPEAGGQLITTTDVENYPGFPDGIMGPDMMMKFEAQAKRFGTDVRFGTVSAVDFSRRPFRLLVDGAKPFTADAVIVSGSTTGRSADLDDLRRVKGAVPHCAVFVGSGVTAKNVKEYLELCDGVIVGSDLKPDGKASNPLEADRVKRFVAAARS